MGGIVESQAREAELRRIFESAVASAHPRQVLAQHLPEPPTGRVIVLAAGKAAASMAAVAEAFYRERGLGPERLSGLAVTRDGYAMDAGLVPVVEGGHPLPNAQGLEASARIVDLARSARPGDLVLALISGGGSANWLMPAQGVSLADKQAVTKALLRSGAGIGEINCVRKHLSQIKGGRLARAVAEGVALLTLAISDVPGDDPGVIASGPTVPDATTLAEARAVVERRAIALPPSCVAALNDPANESPKPGDPAFADRPFHIVSTPRASLEAAARTAEGFGYEVLSLGADLEGEAREVGAEHARMALDAARAGRRVAILSGGELTVTIRGEGRGGPNQEYALALAIGLAGAPGIAALSADTDGTDGGGGLASDPAGAFVSPATLERARAAGIDPAARLADNDSTGFFESVGGLFVPGPTHTNVNDCRVILVG
ncbi:glycerate kinase [Aurantimonas sp. Leaf443]|uniref:glycerate kinase type-2 family protein n=1 Tax=Aurantimonas sp. Leaf443 TaxID=1736378 RepID=UPI0006FCC82B|nr:glycerate kinase [Aurantimonas sp. Leaf443]KQT88003.1 hydroxypyruvate reductase [Aurantimonas sp. Leaf443]